MKELNAQFSPRLGIAANLSTFLSAIVVTVILYALLKPVDKNLALLMLLATA